MQLTIESNGFLFFRKITILNSNKIFATIKFKFSLFQKASIVVYNKTWNYAEKGFVDTSHFITNSENKVIVARKVTTSQQLANSLYIYSSPLITMHIEKSTYSLEKVENAQEYKWLKNGVPIGVHYDLKDLIKSESKLFPRFRGLWKFYATLPEDADELTTSLLFLGMFELIQKTNLAYSS